MFTLSNQDLHSALKTEPVAQGAGGGVEFQVVRLQNSKSDVKLSLHANPNSWSSAGIQTTDFLSYLGFDRSSCAFIVGGQCYSRLVADDFDLGKFTDAFANSFAALGEAERHLEACAFLLDQPEGWGYFYGKPSGTRRHSCASSHHNGRDGHTAPKTEVKGKSEDEYFHFVLTFMSGSYGSDAGWVFHYRPKHLPVSMEIQAALKFLGLKSYEQCPQFDFEGCFWRFIQFEKSEDDFFARNLEFVGGGFGAHSQRFSKGIEKLLSAQALMVPFGIYFLAFERPAPIALGATSAQSQTLAMRSQSPSGDLRDKRKRKSNYEYDVAFSFAGTEREHAEKLAKIARDNGFNVLYDDFYPEQLWGKDLVETFDNIYRKWSRYAVMIISSEYVKRMWTIHERRSILARMLENKGDEYILPIRSDDTEVPGLSRTIAYLKLQDYSVDRIAEILVKKLSGAV
jgi:hypothetical protein